MAVVFKHEEDSHFTGLEVDRCLRCRDTAMRELAKRPIRFFRNSATNVRGTS